MANSKETVRITLEEYKGLLSRGIPSDKDKMILDAICDIITDNSEIVDRNNYNSDFKGIHIISNATLAKQLLTTIYLLDRGRFIDMYKSLANEKRKDAINEMNMEYVRKIKELKENETD